METNNKSKVLLIEDDQAVASLVNHVLSQSGEFYVETATMLREARGLPLEQFDVVVLDLNLPNGRGSETIRSIRPLVRCPIIVYTGITDRSMVSEVISAGADDYVMKDAPPTALIHRINIAVQMHENNKRIARLIDLQNALEVKDQECRALARRQLWIVCATIIGSTVLGILVLSLTS